jgi:alkanesulfonate monooxygenase SsuD/methylene tetrahydromethanopterin reductase-like flavin-dependent oxidoreductase (luciferase family)
VQRALTASIAGASYHFHSLFNKHFHSFGGKRLSFKPLTRGRYTVLAQAIRAENRTHLKHYFKVGAGGIAPPALSKDHPPVIVFL